MLRPRNQRVPRSKSLMRTSIDRVLLRLRKFRHGADFAES
jgi:hypothetical protein